MTTHAQRLELAHLMDELVAQAEKVHYAEIRPMRSKAIDTALELAQALARPTGITLDCSESVTLLCHIAGLDDPNGLGYNGAGYTGTMLDHLEHYSNPRAAGIGALCVFGPGTGEHVCMVRHPGPDPVLFSHGDEAGPAFIRLSAEAPYHRPPVTFLSIANL